MKVTGCPEFQMGQRKVLVSGWLGMGKALLTQAQAELPGSEEASVGLVQAFKHSL